MRINIPWTQLARHQVEQRSIMIRSPKIDHHRNISNRARLDSTLYRQKLRAHVMSRLDADDQSLVLQSHLGCRRGVHIVEVVFKPAAPHAASDNIQHRQNSRLGPIDDRRLELLEVPPSRTTRIDDRCYTRSERKSIGI